MKLTIEYADVTATVQEDTNQIDDFVAHFAALAASAGFHPDTVTQSMGEYYLSHGNKDEGDEE